MKTIIHTTMALVLALGMAMTTAPRAEARNGVGLGIAAGIIGLGVLGAAAAARDYPPPPPYYYSRYNDGRCFRGPRECHWTDRRCFENEYGDTVCRGGRYLCERPVVCN
jgi:hypothetical protein